LKENSANTIKILEGLLSWGKSVLSSSQPAFTEVDINHLLQAVVSYKRKMAADKKIDIRIEAEKNLFATADRNMIEIVFRNILANAIKFSNPGDTVSIFAEKKDDAIHISIIDRGVGIHESGTAMLLEGKIFTSPGTSNEKGAGIGLLLSKELLEKNGGTMTITSKPGIGTQVEIILAA
jgi:signal transduction histidine kinase